MSKENREAAQKALSRDRGLSGGAKFLLITIADLVDDEMLCRVGAPVLGGMVGASKQTVWNQQRELERAGYLVDSGERVRNGVIVYRLLLDHDAEWRPTDPRGSQRRSVNWSSPVDRRSSPLDPHKNRKNRRREEEVDGKNEEKRKTRQSRETVSQSIAKEKNHTLAAAVHACPMCGFRTFEDEFHRFCLPVVCACGERMAMGETILPWGWDSPHHEHGYHELIASPEPEVIAEIRDREWSRRRWEKDRARGPVCCACGEKTHTPSCGVVLGTEEECWEHADTDAPF